MKRELKKYELVERSISKRFRKEIWGPFISAVQEYELIKPYDRIAVCISGGKDSMLMAKLMQMLQRISDFPFEVNYLVMDPGYNEVNRKKIESNAELLNIPITVFETNIFSVANKTEHSPCYLCAKMRRGHLYAKAKEMGCNKIALGHHLSDVIETTLLGMFYGSQIQGMMPKLHSTNFEGMELIRPLYKINEDDIISFARYNELSFIECACKFTEKSAHNESTSKRKEIKSLIKSMRENNPNIEKCIFSSIHSVCLDTFPAYKKDGVLHSFLESYDD